MAFSKHQGLRLLRVLFETYLRKGFRYVSMYACISAYACLLWGVRVHRSTSTCLSVWAVNLSCSLEVVGAFKRSGPVFIKLAQLLALRIGPSPTCIMCTRVVSLMFSLDKERWFHAELADHAWGALICQSE